MFVTIDLNTLAIVGQSHTLDIEGGPSSTFQVEVPRDLYAALLENPTLYSSYGVLNTNNKYSIVPRPRLTILPKLLQITDLGLTTADVVLEISPTAVTLKTDLPITAEVLVLDSEGSPVFHADLQAESPQSLSVNKSMSCFINRPFKELTYSVSYVY